MSLSEKIAPITEKVRAKLSTIDEKQRLYIFIGVLLFFFLLDYFIMMRPQLNTLQKISPEIDILSQDIVKAKEDVKNTDKYRAEVDQLKRKVADINQRVRMRAEVPLILERISVLANSNNVTIDQITPSVIDQRVVLENDQFRYFALPINIEAKCGYHNFGKFINQLQNNDMFLNVGTFTMTSKFGQRKHKIRLTIEAIIYENVN